MANARGKNVDTTSLSLHHAADRGFIHRDYIAHCLRWSHVIKELMHGKVYQTAHLLDVGCGKEAPLPKALFSSRMTHTTGSYTGVDYGKVEKPASISDSGKFNCTFMGETDFAVDKLPRKQYDVIVCFEVLEHVEVLHAFKMLERMAALKPSVIHISTPVYDPKMGAAANHVNEMSWPLLKALIEAAGLEVVSMTGTFASQKDYKPWLRAGSSEIITEALLDALSEQFDSNVVSNIMAPLVPAKFARNIRWTLKPGRRSKVALKELAANELTAHVEHSNSDKWLDDVKEILA